MDVLRLAAVSFTLPSFYRFSSAPTIERRHGVEKSYIQIAIEEFSRRHPEVKLVKSMISSREISELESRLRIIIPDTVKDYFRSYILPVQFVTGKMLGDFSNTYCEETGRWRRLEIEEEIATTVLRLPLMLPNNDLSEFEEVNRAFAGTGYLWLGIYNGENYVLIETQSGQIFQADMERVRLTAEEETRADILQWALPFFHSFEELARCFFAGELYDEDELIFPDE
ncbi:hypothetical protein C816_02801 [Oscillibacter sp. 1-3]|nr:hypothetical protein C816_02801 [Oscillibacter sp. 1-3]